MTLIAFLGGVVIVLSALSAVLPAAAVVGGTVTQTSPAHESAGSCSGTAPAVTHCSFRSGAASKLLHGPVLHDGAVLSAYASPDFVGTIDVIANQVWGDSGSWYHCEVQPMVSVCHWMPTTLPPGPVGNHPFVEGSLVVHAFATGTGSWTASLDVLASPAPLP